MQKDGRGDFVCVCEGGSESEGDVTDDVVLEWESTLWGMECVWAVLLCMHVWVRVFVYGT